MTYSMPEEMTVFPTAHVCSLPCISFTTREIKAELCRGFGRTVVFCSVLLVLGKQRLNEVCVNRRSCCEIRDSVGLRNVQ